jgi:alcohol dehydrogenase class IV
MKELRLHGQKIVTGRGAITYLREIGLKRAFIVTGGQSAFKNGALDRAKEALAAAGCEVCVFSDVPANPPVDIVVDGLAKMREFKPDGVIGLGGGSPIDAAKVMCLFYDYPELDVVRDFRQSLPSVRRGTKFIAIPTTSGTASEVTFVAVLTFPQENIKLAGRTQAFVPDYAILDGDLPLSMPPAVVAQTGMDAVGHAVESFVVRNNNDFSESLAAGAVEGLFRYLPSSYKTGDPLAREKVHNFQCMAGCAFTNTGLGVNHGITHAVGGRYGLSHGLCVGIGLPFVMEFNAQDEAIREKLAYLGKRVGREDFIAAIRQLAKELDAPASLKEAGIPEGDFYANFDELAKNSLLGPTGNNPVPVSEEDARALLRRIYEGK